MACETIRIEASNRYVHEIFYIYRNILLKSTIWMFLRINENNKYISMVITHV